MEQRAGISYKNRAAANYLSGEERRMRFHLIPREEKFFDMFEEASAVLNRAAAKFLDMVTKFDRLPERSNELKEEEHACDQVVKRRPTASLLSASTSRRRPPKPWPASSTNAAAIFRKRYTCAAT
jgi:GTP-binding protein EngB required for normal cell division